MTVKDKQNKCLAQCGKYWLTLTRRAGDLIEFARLRLVCNSWFCDDCRKKKARRFAKVVRDYFAGDRVSILTLTFDRSVSLRDSYRLVNRNWNLLRTQLTKRYGRLKYVRVLEAQSKSGYAHLHVLINKFIPGPWLSVHVPQAGFGRIYDVQEITSAGAFSYVRKYLQKPWTNNSAMQCIIDFNLRLCSGSHGFKLSNPVRSRWKIVDFRSDADSSLEWLNAKIEAHCDFYFTVEEHEFFGGWEHATLGYLAEKSLEPLDAVVDSVEDRFWRVWKCSDLDAGF